MTKQKETKKPKPREKPVNLSGPSFDEVLEALVKIKPMPKDKVPANGGDF